MLGEMSVDTVKPFVKQLSSGIISISSGSATGLVQPLFQPETGGGHFLLADVIKLFVLSYCEPVSPIPDLSWKIMIIIVLILLLINIIIIAA